MSEQDIVEFLKECDEFTLDGLTEADCQRFEEAALLIEALRKQTQPQPIETAPKDGREICIDYYGVYKPAMWVMPTAPRSECDFWGWDIWGVNGDDFIPERWIPLPAPQEQT